MKKGTLLRNKNDGKLAVIIQKPYVRFFPDHNHCDEFDSGEADTAIRIKWIEGGQEHTLRQGRMSRNWEVINEGR